MEKKLTLSSDEILNKEFSLQYKGYVPQEVDSFLDEVLKNYKIIEDIREYYETQNKALQKTNSILRNKLNYFNYILLTYSMRSICCLIFNSRIPPWVKMNYNISRS